jgi:uncharacterized protein YhjY with autotransporter beta-barrel domain
MAHGRAGTMGKRTFFALAATFAAAMSVGQPAQAQASLWEVAAMVAASVATGGAAEAGLGGLDPTVVAGAAAIVAGAGTAMSLSSEALSCPVFVGSGTLLGEDACLWSKVSGQYTNEFSSDTRGFVWRVGGQAALAPGWYLGGTLATGTGWQTAAGGLINGRLQTVDGSVALKWLSGPWLLAGTLGFTTTTNRATRVSVGNAIVQADAAVYKGSAGLRAAYDAAFDGWYLRPRADVSLNYVNVPGFQESGPSPTAVVYYGRSQVGVTLTPALEVGGRIDLGEQTILRPYLVAGAMFRTDNKWTVQGTFAGAAAAFGSFANYYSSPAVIGLFEGGLQLYDQHGIEFRAEYRLATAYSYLSQTASLRLGWHF